MRATLWLLAATAAAASGAWTADSPPPVPREFRAAWVATVDNIDWPSRRGLPASQQQRELLAILDRAARLNLNAVVLQVRPACDALYPSRLEPWSEYLTGRQGSAPEPPYDPLAFAITEAHRRGLELHAWFNPYRARHPSARGPLSPDHVRSRRPDLVREYGRHLWMDPGEPGTQDHAFQVVMDVVRRYDLDGVHIDDYFYPYRERDAAGRLIPFPDEASWERYRKGGGALERDDWRRENVNRFVQRLYAGIKARKRWVKFGISPFGIARPGRPPQIQGFDQYVEIYADAEKWLREGWCDYFAPQLYWRISQTAQAYPVLLRWWTEANPKGRHIWPGNYTSRVGNGGSAWPVGEILEQIRLTRAQPGATGNIHFSMKSLMAGHGGVGEALRAGPYARQALVPASPWLDDSPPPAPRVRATPGRSPGALHVSWAAGRGEPAALWVVWLKRGAWEHQVLPACVTELPELDGSNAGGQPSLVAVAAVDRAGNQSAPAIVRPDR